MNELLFRSHPEISDDSDKLTLRLAKSIGLTTNRRFFNKGQSPICVKKLKSTDVRFFNSKIKKASQNYRNYDFDPTLSLAFRSQESNQPSFCQFLSLNLKDNDRTNETPRKNTIRPLTSGRLGLSCSPKTLKHFPLSAKSIKDVGIASHRMNRTVKLIREKKKRQDRIKANEEHLNAISMNIAAKKAIIMNISTQLDFPEFEQQHCLRPKIRRVQTKKTQKFRFNLKKNRFQFLNPVNSYDLTK